MQIVPRLRWCQCECTFAISNIVVKINPKYQNDISKFQIKCKSNQRKMVILRGNFINFFEPSRFYHFYKIFQSSKWFVWKISKSRRFLELSTVVFWIVVRFYLIFWENISVFSDKKYIYVRKNTFLEYGHVRKDIFLFLRLSYKVCKLCPATVMPMWMHFRD